MKLRKTLIAALCASTLGVAAPLAANAETIIYFNTAPPAARYEAIPAPRAGYTWSTGYWNMKGKKHTWQAGHWERERAGFHFTQPAWTQRDNRWELKKGRWNKGDRDNDGVPNKKDRAPDNPNRS
jgi:hypothetical protein